MVSEGFIGTFFLPQPYKETDDKNIIIRSMILNFIFSYPFKNLLLALLIALKTFIGAVPP